MLAPYRAALAALDEGGTHYPGSPALIRWALRAQDRAVFNELQQEESRALTRLFARDQRVTCLETDAYTAWKAQVPPPERRGLVLVDPPFEKTDEFERLEKGLAMMARKWPTGMAALWYPIKSRASTAALEDTAFASGFTKLLVLELHVDAPEAIGPLAATGLLIANPPWRLQEEMSLVLPELAGLLARGLRASWRAEWLLGP
jgi:23S rRNA (adenine2030-N6)-methyltransferase